MQLAIFSLPFDPTTLAGWGACLAILVASFIKNFKDRNKDKETDYGDPQVMLRVTALDERIHEYLTQLRLQTGAARVFVLRFHNGDVYFDGESIQKVSVSYESFGGGIESIRPSHNGVEVSSISAMLDLMIKKAMLFNVAKDLPDTYSKSLLETLNIHTFAAVALYKNKQKILGCLMVHWINDPTTRSDNPLPKEWLNGQVAKTVELLEFTLQERRRVSHGQTKSPNDITSGRG